MTYQEALARKALIGETVTEKGLLMRVLVVPENREEFLLYESDYRINTFDDSAALKYSTKANFKVYGLWSDGTVVFNKDLTE